MSLKLKKTSLDPIYHQIELDNIAIQIINTPPFQRLRHLNQTGLVEYVFPGARHNRFSHSLGVYHLADLLLTRLSINQPELKITENEKTCVKIAGLVHDLGHGPWSHTLDQYLELRIPLKDHLVTYRHEERSCRIFKKIVSDYKIPLTSEQVNTICYLVDPKYRKKPFEIRDFLVDIVSNNKDGLDVDKLDYLQRDPYYIGLTYKIDYTRLFAHVRVVGGHLSYPLKTKSDIHDVFYYRLKLHREIYQHPIVRSMELLIYDLFDEIKDMILESLKLETDQQFQDFLSLTDVMIHSLYYSNEYSKSSPKIKELIDRLYQRNLYHFLGEIKYNSENNQKLLKELNEKYPEIDLITYHSVIGYKENPLNKISFYYDKGLNLVKDDNYGLDSLEESFRIYSRTLLNENQKKNIINSIKSFSNQNLK